MNALSNIILLQKNYKKFFDSAHRVLISLPYNGEGNIYKQSSSPEVWVFDLMRLIACKSDVTVL